MHFLIAVILAVSCAVNAEISIGWGSKNNQNSRLVCRAGQGTPGIENWECIDKDAACYQNVHCRDTGLIKTKIEKFYSWGCVEKSRCKKSTDGKFYAELLGNRRALCCFTDKCNAYKLDKCTSSGALRNIIAICSVIAFGSYIVFAI